MNKILAFSMLLITTPLWAKEMDMTSMEHMSSAQDKTKSSTTKQKVVTKTIKKSNPLPQATPNHGAMNMSNMDHSSMDMSNMDHGSMDMSNMDHSSMDMSNMDHGSMDMSKMDHGSMGMSNMDHGSMKMGKMQGGRTPKDARSSDYSQGRDYGPIAPPHMMGNGIMMSALFDQLELSRNNDQTSGNYVFDGWIGNDWNRLALKAEGEIAKNKLEEARTELLWRKPIGIFWNTELGIRQDSGIEKSQSWLAMGVNGISPYWMELGATVYVAKDNRTALRAEATYDWRILQRVILQPSLEANLYGKTDVARNIGKGLSDIQAGMRLRYEVTRQFAPYIGIETTQQFGKTADLIKASGEKAQKTSAVAGIRFWF